MKFYPEDLEHKNFAAGMKAGESAGKADAHAGAERSPGPVEGDPVNPAYGRGWRVGYDQSFDTAVANIKAKKSTASAWTAKTKKLSDDLFRKQNWLPMLPLTFSSLALGEAMLRLTPTAEASLPREARWVPTSPREERRNRDS